MTQQRTTHTLLAVVVALLGLHLALRLSPQEATAQPGPPEEPPVEPRVVAVSVNQQWSSDIYGNTRVRVEWLVTRAWDDGQVDVTTMRLGTASCPVPNPCGNTEVVIPGQ